MRNKSVAVTGATTGGFGAVWAQAELRKVLATTGGRVVEGEVAIGHATDRFDPLGRLDDPNLEEQGARWRSTAGGGLARGSCQARCLTRPREMVISALAQHRGATLIRSRR